MCPSQDGDSPVVEPNPAGDDPDVTLRALQQRIRQQEILAELGVLALHGASLDALLAGHRELRIRHGSATYRLRLTASGKLILTK